MTVYETDNHPQSAVQHRELYLISHGNIMGSVGRLVVSNSLQPYGLQPTRLLCPWDSPDKNTGVGCHFLLQGDLPDPGIEPRSPALQADSLLSELPGKPQHYTAGDNHAGIGS